MTHPSFSILGHLIHRFGITENDWHRIKQNIDSKCRTAFRRKQRGMPLTVKAFRGKAPPTYVNIGSHLPGELGCQSDEDSISHEDSELHIHQVQSKLETFSFYYSGRVFHYIQFVACLE